MIRTAWFTNAAAAKSYYQAADYFASSPGTWLGKGAEMLGLTGEARAEDFDRLVDNLHPQTGEPLTAHTRDGRRVGLDMTFNSTKSVGIARELAGAGNEGDPRIEEAHREAVAYTVGLVEAGMQARVRAGGANGNRTTGNVVAYRVTHRDTRINAEDSMPDMALHDHIFFVNATYDKIECKWKAAELGQIKHDLPFYEAAYHNRLASNLKALGYGVERKGKAFEVAGISREMIEKFSRRTAYIEKVAGKLGITNPETKAKLGATTRLGKVKETADDLNRYYVSRLTDSEKRGLSSLQGRASSERSVEAAVGYAIGHLFERFSVVDEKRLYEAALRHGIGSVTVDGVQAEARRQGLLVKDGEATTRSVLAEEQKVIAFARDGRGTCKPMGKAVRTMRDAGPDGQPVGERSKTGDGPPALVPSPLGATAPSREPGANPAHDHRASNTATPSPDPQAVSAPPRSELGTDQFRRAREGQEGVPSRPAQAKTADAHDATPPSSDLSPEQTVMVNHVLTSTDRVMLVIGDAGTGKTFAVKHAFRQISRPVDIIAPSADASRGVLRREGFAEADTVTAFLRSPDRQEAVRNGVIWVDEAGLLPIRDLSALVDVAREQGARLVLQGDPKQHRSVARDGNMLNVLQSHAGLPVARLKDIRRQRGKYKQAVTALAEGRTAAGFDGLNDLGWVKQTTDHQPLVDDYLAAVDARKEVLAIAPTHAEAGEVTAAIRDRLKERGLIGGDERVIETLRPLHWTEAERGDLERFEGSEVLQWHRNGGTQKAGDRVAVADFRPGQRLGPASTFAVYGKQPLALAPGDRIRITSNGKTADGKHRLDNGAQYAVAGFEKDGKIRLTNGWFIAADFKHFTHGYVTTSHASQGKTVDRVLIAMGQESVPAIGAEQFYVSVSRGREQATIYTDVKPAELREAVQRADQRKSATEMMKPKPRPKRRGQWWVARKARAAWEALRTRASAAMPEVVKQREHAHHAR